MIQFIYKLKLNERVRAKCTRHPSVVREKTPLPAVPVAAHVGTSTMRSLPTSQLLSTEPDYFRVRMRSMNRLHAILDMSRR